MGGKTVFISYRRDTGCSFARSLQLALQHQGYDVFLDVDSLEPGPWPGQLQAEVQARDHCLLLLTPGALERCAAPDDWVRQEFLLALQSRRNLVPVREESVDLAQLQASADPAMQPLFGLQIADIRHASFEADVKTLVERYIPPHKAPPAAGPKPEAPGFEITRLSRHAPEYLLGRDDELALLDWAWNPGPQPPVLLPNLTTRPHILSLVAIGGEGKTSLAARWAGALIQNPEAGCETAYAWSFYSQGSREQSNASADWFLREALLFFGDAALADSNRPAAEKGKRLAALACERRALLVLDGVEPLQYPPASPLKGQLKDPGLAALLKALAQRNRGLCLITSRLAVAELQSHKQTTAPTLELTRLPTAAGVALLETLGVKGGAVEKRRLVEDVRGHALTLTLLGSYLHEAHQGDIRRRDRVKLEQADREELAGHAFRAMDAYVAWFESPPAPGGRGAGGEGKHNRQALALLQLLGLFDRPAEAGCLEALLRPPVIAGLTDALFTVEKRWFGLKRRYQALPAERLSILISRLEEAKLLSAHYQAGALAALDAHPLLREYFAARLREQQPQAFRQGHARLFRHLCGTTQDKAAPSLDELQPLYQAVAHGCWAGLQQEACDKVYRDRILKGTGADGVYSLKKLGAFGVDLGAVAGFFEEPWRRVSPALAEGDQAWLLSVAAFHLRALGRLAEALQPMRAGLDMAIQQKDWQNAAAGANNLSELALTLGQMKEAEAQAEAAVTYADRSGDAFFKMMTRTALADARWQAGQALAAAELFQAAEVMQAERQPDYPLLYSLFGFRYCELLLAPAERAAWRAWLSFPRSARECSPGRSAARDGDAERRGRHSHAERGNDQVERGNDGRDEALAACRAVTARAAQTLEWAQASNASLISIALEHLTLARAQLYAVCLRAAAEEPSELREYSQAALDGLRRYGDATFLPLGLLTRAWLRGLEGRWTGADSAREDLDEAWDIAGRGPMPLFQADIHLHRARLFGPLPPEVCPYPWQSPAADLAEARRLIEQHGYGRRLQELADAEAATPTPPLAKLTHWPPPHGRTAGN